MIKVAIVGASGYTGVELARLLHAHPEVEIACVTSRQNVGEELAALFPSLHGAITQVCDDVDVDLVCAKADFIFTALPHRTAMAVVPAFLHAGKRVVDLSADYRLREVSVYEQWYQAHTSPELLAEAVYGLPEIYRDKIAPARLVANPGCYPTSVALALKPLLVEGLVDVSTLVVDAKSGTSGAGRAAKVASLFCEVNEGFKPYGVAGHRHTPEIEQTLGDVAGAAIRLTFTPHLLPVNRGILSTCYAQFTAALSVADLRAIYRNHYEQEFFVRLLPEGVWPNIANVRGSNFCDLNLTLDPRTGKVIVAAAIDNLVKGAAGQAVQNMNLMHGFEERLGLAQLPLFP
ncbi:N-acetyl-gamma-glutamyl-phosphate reductase [Geoalkalibacter halelectricus]|uniref:N-acetyl-gamma-glutamyl-phosphate reductase n=1 Tax=Geoalkalibacter halelectricus TaxID=2847045 RepID=A0ABY5ZLL7_9BACT|nr:N-acetyl-gamma-glutamyl-phosphate reductase [Geoalkalibacter halelectricus]MDO3379423.1 N-acetyl-gamma-glutamyl-phosphate reductase [Geoalkalibacter halelectricus]UWZ78700.1 N-acetyl-gamma-glutamyl-phosphate reductase [Geoalkalibacter halelectricus]